MVKARVALDYIDGDKDRIASVADEVWRFAETGLKEYRSADAICEVLESQGFKIERPVSGMPTAFVASWGEGRPCIGYLGEYDALPGLSQEAVPYRKEVSPGEPGHGCGHNLLGVGAMAAAIGLKKQMEVDSISGTVKYFGCPAEENFSGKAFMARDGLFEECDACLTWHAGGLNRVKTGSSLANNSFNVHFEGRTAHAAGDPHNGRSALDAVQLMNLAVEFLREHVIPERTRFHYVIKDGGGQPNVVPAKATVWYLVRAATRKECDELYARILDCAYGAAQMTGTTCRVEMIKAIWNLLPNIVLENLLDDCLKKVGPPAFTKEDMEFGEKIAETFSEERNAFFKAAQIPEEVKSQLLNVTYVPKQDPPPAESGSTDVADCSWSCPTAQITTACQVIGTPGHSWQYAAQAGMGIGHAGMITAAKVLAEAGYVLMTDAETLGKAAEEFKKATRGKPFRSALLPGQMPAFDQSS